MGCNNICIPHGLYFFLNTLYIYIITSSKRVLLTVWPCTSHKCIEALGVKHQVTIYLHSGTLQVLYKASLQLLLVFPCCEKQLQVSDGFCMCHWVRICCLELLTICTFPGTMEQTRSCPHIPGVWSTQSNLLLA